MLREGVVLCYGMRYGRLLHDHRSGALWWLRWRCGGGAVVMVLWWWCCGGGDVVVVVLWLCFLCYSLYRVGLWDL